MSNEANMPAFPSFDAEGCCGPTIGLTKREYFAAMAMQGFCANGLRDIGGQPSDTLAIWSVKHADALLAELAKGEK